MPGAARFSASDTRRSNRKAKTRGLFPNRESCSEAASAVFCREDFSPARSGDTTTCGAPRRRGAQTPRLLAASDKNEGKSFQGSPLFFPVTCALATAFLRDRGQVRKSAD